MNTHKFETPVALRAAGFLLSIFLTAVLFGGITIGLTLDAVDIAVVQSNTHTD